ncbi:MAG: transketolase [Coriobacteriia bacterium]|nr:transketolase [Coriobacteriia bacterium]MCL2870094.1 transketolase [Coriobacteriia bacterium]
MSHTREFSPSVDFDPQFVSSQATQMRIDIVKMLSYAGSGHPGGSLSAADIVATLYFGGVMNYDPQAELQGSRAPWRDRFILSKGHAAPVQYAALARAGYFDAQEFKTLRHLGAMLQGHPDASKCPGVEVSTGSLGQGLSIAAGLAQGLMLKGQMDKDGQAPPRVYVLLGDGELQEGQNWEAALYAAHYGLDNVVAIVDRNMLQIDGNTEDVMTLGDVAAKFEAFGWEATTIDGHDIPAVHQALTRVRTTGKPYVIVADTVKGKGVSFMEDVAGWHGVAPCAEQCATACAELEPQLSCIASAGIIAAKADTVSAKGGGANG